MRSISFLDAAKVPRLLEESSCPKFWPNFRIGRGTFGELERGTFHPQTPPLPTPFCGDRNVAPTCRICSRLAQRTLGAPREVRPMPTTNGPQGPHRPTYPAWLENVAPTTKGLYNLTRFAVVLRIIRQSGKQETVRPLCLVVCTQSILTARPEGGGKVALRENLLRFPVYWRQLKF